MPLLALAIGAVAVLGYVFYRSSHSLRSGQAYYIAIDVTSLPLQGGVAGLAALMAASGTWSPIVVYGVPPAPPVVQPPAGAPSAWLSAWGTGRYAIAVAKWVGKDETPKTGAGAGVLVFGTAPSHA